jgi:hypothetical protein
MSLVCKAKTAAASGKALGETEEFSYAILASSGFDRR